MSCIFVFLDGVGLAPAGPDNPLSVAPTPHLRALLGRNIVQGPRIERPNLLFDGIDATLGVEGLPQSGTGQTALFAGVNAAQLHGRHQPHVPPVALRPLLAEQNMLRRVVRAGGTATFANAFGDAYWDALAARRTRKSASVIATEGAGIRFRTIDDLRIGQAMAWDIVGNGLRELGADITPITPAQAGRTLAALAYTNDLVFYENFLPDLTGHGRTGLDIAQVFGLIDELLGATIGSLRPQDTLVLTSDHGNVESYAAPTHTRNPVPLLVVGPGAPAFFHVDTISAIAEPMVAVALGRSAQAS